MLTLLLENIINMQFYMLKYLRRKNIKSLLNTYLAFEFLRVISYSDESLNMFLNENSK